jgi:galactose mutarotase-like enzyme
MEIAGREWLWRNTVIPYATPVDGASYVETGDTGGYDECFPTIAPCTLPTSVARFGGLSLPDHGELWSQSTTFSLETREDGMYAASGWEGRRMPYHFVRELFVSRDDRVEMRYAVTNAGPAPLPFIWAAHPLLPLTETTRLIFPDSTRVRVWSQQGIELGGPGAELRWPRAAVGGKLVDFSTPDTVARSYACMLFLDVPTGYATIEEAGARLQVTFDTSQVSHVGLWINKRRWTPFRAKRPYCNLALEPCIGGAGSLTEALGAWRNAAWIKPGETRTWQLVWRAVPALSTLA